MTLTKRFSFLLAFAATPLVLAQNQVFSDVQGNSPYYNATTTMYQLGVSRGCVQPVYNSNGQFVQGQFCPNDNLLRQDMAAWVVRAWSIRIWNDPEAFQTRAPINTNAYFSDVPSSNPQFIYIQKLYELAITTGTVAPQIDGNGTLVSQGQFAPADTLLNYQIAVFVDRARALSDYSCVAAYSASPKPFQTSSNASCAQDNYTWSTNPYFGDVPASDPYFKFIQRFGDTGAVNPPSSPAGYPGCSSCVFGENTTMVRGPMAMWTVSGIVLDARALLSMNTPGSGGGSNYYATRPTLTAQFTYSLHDQAFHSSDIGYAEFLLADSNGGVHCLGDWGRPSALALTPNDPASGNWNVTYTAGASLSNPFCKVSVVSITDSAEGDPTELQVKLNFTFNAGFTGTYSVMNLIVYNSGYITPWQSVGTLDLLAPNGSPPQYQLTTAISGAGSVIPSCSSGCAYSSGSQVQITATPSGGYQFDHWSGDASGTNSTVSVTMNANRSVVANFTPVPDFTLSSLPTQYARPGTQHSAAESISSSGGFQQSVSLACTSCPAGISVSFSPASVIPGNSTQLSFNVASGTLPGTYTVAIQGTAGTIQHTANYTVYVADATLYAGGWLSAMDDGSVFTYFTSYFVGSEADLFSALNENVKT